MSRWNSTEDYRAYREAEKALLQQYPEAERKVFELLRSVDWKTITLPEVLEFIDTNRVDIGLFTGLARLKKNSGFLIEDLDIGLEKIKNDTSKSSLSLRRVSSKQTVIFIVESGPIKHIWPNRFLGDVCKKVQMGPRKPFTVNNKRIPGIMFFGKCEKIISDYVDDNFQQKVVMTHLKSQSDNIVVKEDIEEKTVITY